MAEWHVYDPDSSIYIREGERFILGVHSREIAEQIVRDHNEAERVRSVMELPFRMGLVERRHGGIVLTGPLDELLGWLADSTATDSTDAPDGESR